MEDVNIHTNQKQSITLWFLITIAFVACYYRVFLWFNYNYLLQDSYFSHGYLIPVVSAYLIYLKRNQLILIPHSTSHIGLGFIIMALLLHIFAVIGNIHFISGFSILIYVSGCCLYLLGLDLTKKISFPIFFLIFMCPIPSEIIDVVALPFKSMATSLSLHIIGLLGIPYIREGFRIHLPLATFIVGTPCNGMRSLISFLALGFLLLYFIRTSLWKKVLLFALILPISILFNGMRIAILLWVANTYGQDAASPESYLHDGSGILVFILGLATLMIIYRFINENRQN